MNERRGLVVPDTGAAMLAPRCFIHKTCQTPAMRQLETDRKAWLARTTILCWCVAARAAENQRVTQRILIISIDGLRPDLLLRADTPTVHALVPNSTFTFRGPHDAARDHAAIAHVDAHRRRPAQA